MKAPQERILLVESDPEVCDLIDRQTLRPLGYRVGTADSAAAAIQAAIKFSPDVIVADLELPGLSGKDLLVALSSQGINSPVVVLAKRGMEADIIQAFRLGAADYLLVPVREAEVVSAVERALIQVRARREREQLARQLNQANLELQRRVKELTAIFSIGKSVTSITEQRSLFNKIVEAAISVAEADCGWLLLRKNRTKTYLLSSFRNLPQTFSARINQPWEDGISNLVALSGESLAICGEPLKRFKAYQLGKAALVVPVKAKREVVGLLVVMRSEAKAFSPNNQTLLEAMADYASISLVNASLFRALEDRARALEQAAQSRKGNDQASEEAIQELCREIRSPLMVAMGYISMITDGELGSIESEQAEALEIARAKLQHAAELLSKPLQRSVTVKKPFS